MKQAQPGWALPQRVSFQESLSDFFARVENIYDLTLNAERSMAENLNAFKDMAGELREESAQCLGELLLERRITKHSQYSAAVETTFFGAGDYCGGHQNGIGSRDGAGNAVEGQQNYQRHPGQSWIRIT